jgi:hypothetical protein
MAQLTKILTNDLQTRKEDLFGEENLTYFRIDGFFLPKSQQGSELCIDRRKTFQNFLCLS